uniref:Purple acid phosphatase n=1 Tax=Globisporangium ultimum (strain ATCC 200006 / CBS 805.95 / DAOM BR144) TaxID=431595 RepID=K3WND8_GLOUD
MRMRIAAISVFAAFACCVARCQVKAHAAAVCVYDYDALSCGPLGVCRMQYTASDATPAQACRSIDMRHDLDAAKMQPQQLHLAFAEWPAGSGMTISWTTFVQVDDPKVWIGATQAELVLADAAIETKSYYSDKRYSLYNYHATVRGLSASTKYFYKVGSTASPEWQSDVASFVTSRAAGSQDTFSLAIYGDFGAGKHAAASNRYVNALVDKVDFIYHVGDISYADDAFLHVKEFTGFHYEETYNRWMNSLTPLMRQVPYMVVVGNHEAECHSPSCVLSSAKKDQLGNYTAFNTRFKMPSTESHGTKNMWYSFDYASAHFTTISSETDYVGAPSNAYAGRKNGNFGNQMAWLEADLKKADANRVAAPWLIVGMHRPLYTICTSSKAGASTGEALPVQKAFEELFIKYKVDLVVSGHVHGYERQYPIAHSQPVLDGVSSDSATYMSPKAPVYIISGAPGSPEGLVRYKKNSERAWNARFDDTYNGIGLLQVAPRTLSWSFASTDSSQTLDSFAIVKEPSISTAVA